MIDLSRVKRANDPLSLKGRKRRKQIVSSILIGGTLLTLSYLDTQASVGEQKREAIFTSQVIESDHARNLIDQEVLCVTFFLTSGTSWSVPADWNSSNNTVECIGGGGSGGAAGATNYGGAAGGGAYSKAVNVPLTPNGSAAYSVGLGGASVNTTGAGVNGNAGGDTWFNGTSLSSASCSAQGGARGNFGTPPAVALGGQAANGIGSTKFNGGNGPGTNGGGGGGGAAGPNAAGNNGLSGTAASIGGDGGRGGGSSGGLGGAGSSTTGSNGNPGTEFDASHGSGGGGGGSNGSGGAARTGGNGGLYGGGGGAGSTNGFGLGTSGAGAQGLIVVTYTPAKTLMPYRRTTRFFTRSF